MWKDHLAQTNISTGLVCFLVAVTEMPYRRSLQEESLLWPTDRHRSSCRDDGGAAVVAGACGLVPHVMVKQGEQNQRQI